MENLNGNTVDTLIEKMDQPEIKKNLFDEWKNDYKLAKELANKEFFYFYQEKAVETEKDMTIELCHYVDKNRYTLEIIKEGLNPEFILNGITYTAFSSNSIYNDLSNVFYSEICCSAKNPNELYKKTLSKKQETLKTIFKISVFHVTFLIFALLFIGRDGF